MNNTTVLIVSFWLFWAVALHSLVGDSPTMDEQNHLARGAAYIFTGDPRLSVEHPPLVNGLSGLMLWPLPEVRLPIDQPSWQREPAEIFWYLFANEFMWNYNAHQVGVMVFLGRLPIVWLTMLLSLVGYWWGNKLWGHPAGLLTALFLLFDPHILAHGRYITTDLGGTLFTFLATAVIWHQWHTPQKTALFWMGLAMAAAFASKLLGLVFVPIWFLLALFYPAVTWTERFYRVGQILAAGLLSILFVWLIFGLEWGNFLFLDERLKWANLYSGPMPTFWSGIERILLLSDGGRPSYLWGEFSTEGFLAYFPVAFLVKTPSLTLFLLPLAIGWLLYRPPTRSMTLWLLTPAVFYFAFSLTSALNIGYRHLLPMLPFLYLLLAGGVVQWSLPAVPPVRRAAVVAGLFILSTLSIHPHYLSFFNLLAGGPEKGYTILIDSNIDWGQDLLRLQEWMAENQVTSINLSWFGSAPPAAYGLAYEPLPGYPHHLDLWWNMPFDPAAPPPGWYAISVSNLGEPPLRTEEKTRFSWFRNHEPTGRIGYSINLYYIPQP